MSTLVALLLLAASFALTVAASVVLARELDRLGERLGFSEALLGMVTALGADAPEIASAVAAVVAGHEDTGVGVVVGSSPRTDGLEDDAAATGHEAVYPAAATTVSPTSSRANLRQYR